ncbi:MAG: histidinol dehydrogenase, partial [Clostridiales bacterium]|nr:histidinol dehydrogenase [Clostridiales bacterium]
MIRLVRYSEGGEDALNEILSRGVRDAANAQIVVDEILAAVKKEGDPALLRFTERFDRVKLSADDLRVTPEELDQGAAAVGAELNAILAKAAQRIENYHVKQKQNSWFDMSENGEVLGQIVRPVESCGVYAPGGTALYPSTVLMNAVPARIAGVKRIVMVTPPGADGNVAPILLAAARAAGVEEIYKVGGAQSIAALAYGTRTIPKVDKIVGPGNIYVALAKKSVYGAVSIDSVAGPSEILVLTDETANAAYVAADMLSQAEHDEMASSIFITTDIRLAERVTVELEKQTALLSRKNIIEKSLDNYGLILVVENMEQGVQLANRVAPEHLEIIVKDTQVWLPRLQNAGAIFIGEFSPEPLGDYMAGPNHV